MKAVVGSLPEAAKGYLGYVLGHLQGQVLPLITAAVEARTDIHSAMKGNRYRLIVG